MIVDKLENANLYTSHSVSLAKAFEILKDSSLADKDPGKYEVDGDNLFYLVNRYTTKPLEECKFEAHQKYIDIQYILAGSEIIGYAPADTLTVKTPYNPEKDIAFYDTPENFSPIKVPAGTFCLFFPEDAHLPACQLDNQSDICKIVIKVRIEN